jgi:uncharacterized phage protein gp47/JayE
LQTVDEIYQSLLDAFTVRAGYTPDDSCDLGARLYAAAAQLQALSVQADWVLDQSFPQTAAGEYLDRHAALRGLTRIAAVRASGTLRLRVDSAPAGDLAVEAGTVCMTGDAVRFETTAAAVLPAGALFVDIPAQAVEAGASGNAPSGTITILAACPTGITGCTNPAAFTGGVDAEGDDALRARVLESYQRLPNGANAAYYERTAMAHTGVVAAKAVGRARGIGTVDVYVATAAGVPDSALLAEVQSDLAACREIAVDVRALAPTPQSVNVSVEVAAADDADAAAVRTAVGKAVTGCFTGALLGKSVLAAELGQVIYAVSGVANYHLLAPTADTATSASVLPVLGTLSVSALEEA